MRKLIFEIIEMGLFVEKHMCRVQLRNGPLIQK